MRWQQSVKAPAIAVAVVAMVMAGWLVSGSQGMDLMALRFQI